MRPTRRQLLGTSPALTIAPVGRAEDAVTKLLIVVGPSQHPPGTHEVAAGGRLMKHCLETARRRVKAEVVTEWPGREDVRRGRLASSSSATCSRREVMPNRERIMADLAAMMERGCGMVCVHYATGLEAKHVDRGRRPPAAAAGSAATSRPAATHHHPSPGSSRRRRSSRRRPIIPSSAAGKRSRCTTSRTSTTTSARTARRRT